MLTYWHSIVQPALYHGHGKKRGFFEGWYYKLVDATGQERLAVIPGVFLGQDEASSHAFIQILDGVSGHTAYLRYPLSAFAASRREFAVALGPNRFRAAALSLDITTAEAELRGTLRFTGLTPWPVTPGSPGAMGWFAFLPFLECYHGVLSLDHAIEGELTFNGRSINFTGGRGYIEKDWGRSFPQAWIWLQSNHFATPGTSLMASVARVPLLGRALRGFIVGLWHGGQLYRFATYTGAAITELRVTDTQVHLILTGKNRSGPKGRIRRHRLEITAQRSAAGSLLHQPTGAAMVQRVAETLSAAVAVRLVELEGRGERVLYEGLGRHAGLEVMGPVQTLR